MLRDIISINDRIAHRIFSAKLHIPQDSEKSVHIHFFRGEGNRFYLTQSRNTTQTCFLNFRSPMFLLQSSIINLIYPKSEEFERDKYQELH